MKSKKDNKEPKETKAQSNKRNFAGSNKNIKQEAIHKEIKDLVIINSIRKTNLPTDILRYIGTFLLEDYYTML